MILISRQLLVHILSLNNSNENIHDSNFSPTINTYIYTKSKHLMIAIVVGQWSTFIPPT